MRIMDGEVIISIERFVHNLVATGMKLDELPLLYKKINECTCKLLEVPDYDQTS